MGKCCALAHALPTRSVGRRPVRRTRPHPHRWRRGGRRRSLGAPSHERGVGPRGKPPAGPRPMQLRYETGLTGEEYVSAQAWRDARLERCPNHPHGSCSLARHDTHARKTTSPSTPMHRRCAIRSTSHGVHSPSVSTAAPSSATSWPCSTASSRSPWQRSTTRPSPGSVDSKIVSPNTIWSETGDHE